MSANWYQYTRVYLTVRSANRVFCCELRCLVVLMPSACWIGGNKKKIDGGSKTQESGEKWSRVMLSVVLDIKASTPLADNANGVKHR